MINSRPQPPVTPHPLHNRDATLRSLARQLRMDIDEDSIETAIATPTMINLLDALIEALDRPARQRLPEPAFNLVESTDNPNLRHWVQRAQRDIEAAEEDGVPRQLPTINDGSY